MSQKYKGRKYRVKKDAYSRIQILEGDKIVDELCIVPTVQCPDGDRLLSKVILLECDEEYVLKTSNHFKPGGVEYAINVAASQIHVENNTLVIN